MTTKRKKRTTRGRKRKSTSHKKKGLFGLAAASSNKKQNWTKALGQTGLHLLCLTGGGIAGAAAGKSSLLVGLPLLYAGLYKNKPYLATAAMGMIVSNGYRKGTTSTEVQSVEGLPDLDPKKLAIQAKERATGFIQNMGEKLFLPGQKEEPGQVDGINEGQPTYFISPFSPAPAYSSGTQTYEALPIAEEAPDNL